MRPTSWGLRKTEDARSRPNTPQVICHRPCGSCGAQHAEGQPFCSRLGRARWFEEAGVGGGSALSVLGPRVELGCSCRVAQASTATPRGTGHRMPQAIRRDRTPAWRQALGWVRPRSSPLVPSRN